MSYQQRFLGWFDFSSRHGLEAGLDALEASRDDIVLDLTAFELACGNGASPLEIRIDHECSASASMYEATLLALAALGRHATSGAIETTIWLDDASHDVVGAAGRTATADLPARHHRWDVFLAAWYGDTAWLAELARAGISLEQRFPAYRGYTTLHVAASRPGGAAAVGALLEAGLSAASTTSSGSPVLAVAADQDILLRLIAAGADPSANDGQAFVHAVNCDRQEVARLLLAAGVKLSARRYGELLGAAARNGRPELFEWLLGHPDMKPMLEEPGIIASALRIGEPELLDVIVRHGVRVPDTLLTDAIAEGATALVERLLAEPGAIARCGSSNRRLDAMCVAAAHARIGVLERLASMGVPLVPATAGETSPVHEAAMSDGLDPVDCLAWLVEHGASVTSRDASGRTPVEAAASAGRAEAIAWLIAHGAPDL